MISCRTHRTSLSSLTLAAFLGVSFLLPPATEAAPPATLHIAQAAPTKAVQLKSEDGMLLHALYAPGKDRGKGVVLLHMLGRSSEDWKEMIEKLSAQGMHVIAIDLRGHGQSTKRADGTTLPFDKLTEKDYQAMTQDVAAAVSYLRTKTSADPEQVVLMGASIGANLAIRYAADDARIANVLLLSPGLDYKGVSTEDAVQRYGQRPLYLAVSREDTFAAKSCLVLDALAKGKHHMEIFTGVGHGTKMLAKEASLEPALLAWINGTFQPKEPAATP